MSSRAGMGTQACPPPIPVHVPVRHAKPHWGPAQADPPSGGDVMLLARLGLEDRLRKAGANNGQERAHQALRQALEQVRFPHFPDAGRQRHSQAQEACLVSVTGRGPSGRTDVAVPRKVTWTESAGRKEISFFLHLSQATKQF